MLYLTFVFSHSRKIFPSDIVNRWLKETGMLQSQTKSNGHYRYSLLSKCDGLQLDTNKDKLLKVFFNRHSVEHFCTLIDKCNLTARWRCAAFTSENTMDAFASIMRACMHFLFLYFLSFFFFDLRYKKKKKINRREVWQADYCSEKLLRW